jgi:hypothetical protein
MLASRNSKSTTSPAAPKLAKGEVLEGQLRAGAEGRTQRSKEAHEQGGHGWIMHEGRKSRSDRSSIVVTVGKMAARMTTWRRTAVRVRLVL